MTHNDTSDTALEAVHWAASIFSTSLEAAAKAYQRLLTEHDAALARLAELEASHKRLLKACKLALSTMLTTQSDIFNVDSRAEEGKALQPAINAARAAIAEAERLVK